MLTFQRYRTPPQAKLTLFKSRVPLAQERFWRDVLQAYDATSTAHKGELWCVIQGRWLPETWVKAVHIVRYNIGELTAGHLFGQATDENGHLMSAMNGLPMSEIYEKAFDEARIGIVPNNEVELVVVALDEDIKNTPPTSTSSGLPRLDSRFCMSHPQLKIAPDRILEAYFWEAK
jgi:hypothetical protein